MELVWRRFVTKLRGLYRADKICPQVAEELREEEEEWHILILYQSCIEQQNVIISAG